MDQILNLAGNVAAVVGALLCAVMGLARVSGLYVVGGFEASMLFNVGTGLMVFACLVKLEQLRRQNGAG